MVACASDSKKEDEMPDIPRSGPFSIFDPADAELGGTGYVTLTTLPSDSSLNSAEGDLADVDMPEVPPKTEPSVSEASEEKRIVPVPEWPFPLAEDDEEANQLPGRPVLP